MTLRHLQLRVRALFDRDRADQELGEELAFHVECETRKLVDRGFDPADARRRALAHFGSRPATADACRDERGTGGIDSLVRDLIYAWRAFRRTPLAVLTIVVTIAIGLAMTTTAFSVFNAIFLRVDDVNRPGELFAVRRVVNSRAWKPFTLGEYEAFRRDTAVFAGTAALSGGMDLRVDGRLARARLVTGEFFQVLGVAATHGRVLTPSDSHPGAVLDPSAYSTSIAVIVIACAAAASVPAFRAARVDPSEMLRKD